MAKKLDLTAFKRQYFDVTLPDGTEIQIGKPTQSLIIDLMAMEQQINEDAGEMIELFNDVILKILNNNKEQKKYTAKYVQQQFDFEVGQIFIMAYMEFVQEIQSNPNF